MRRQRPLSAGVALERWQAGLLLLVGPLSAHAIARIATESALSWCLVLEATLLVLAVLAPLAARIPVERALGLSRPGPVAFAAAVLGTLCLGPLGRSLSLLVPGGGNGIDPLDGLATTQPFWVMWTTCAAAPAIAEELFFRGAVQRAFGRGLGAVLLSATAFALFHGDPARVLTVFPGALYIAWAAQRTSSTFVAIAAHLANNTWALASAKLASSGYAVGLDVNPVLLAGPTVLLAALTVPMVAPPRAA